MAMRIRSIEVSDFKSLVGFRLDLAKYNCLIGLNGAGKSTVLQFIDFLAQQVRGNLSGWFEERGWKPKEVLSALTHNKTVAFGMTFVDDKGRPGIWRGMFNPSRLRCTFESLITVDADLLVAKGCYTIKSAGREIVSERIPFVFEGSILSQLRKEVLPPSLQKLKEFVLSIESLDLLSPERLRQRARESHGSLGYGGRHLAAFLADLEYKGRAELARRLKRAYRQLRGIHAVSAASGVKRILVEERYSGKEILTEARHVNDGMLRVIAILAELASDHQFLLFDEIENGINPDWLNS